MIMMSNYGLEPSSAHLSWSPLPNSTENYRISRKAKRFTTGDSLCSRFGLANAKSDKALPLLQKAYAASTEAELKAKIALQIGIIYFDQQKWEFAQKTLEDALAFKNDYAPLNNLLSYLYATKGNNLKKANELIALALQKDPHNPHFLDTKALILYKENKFDQAIPILQKVAHAHPTDYTVLCHLGKCYYKNGNTKKAIDTMKAAVQIAKNGHDKTKAEAQLKEWSK